MKREPSSHKAIKGKTDVRVTHPKAVKNFTQGHAWFLLTQQENVMLPQPTAWRTVHAAQHTGHDCRRVHEALLQQEEPAFSFLT